MSALTQIYDELRSNFTTVYVEEFPQSVDIKSKTPLILIQDVATVGTPNKDRRVKDFMSIRVHVVCSEYKACRDRAETIRLLLDGFTSTNIDQMDFEEITRVTPNDIETNQIVIDFTIIKK